MAVENALHVEGLPEGKRRRKVGLTREAATAIQELIEARGLDVRDRIFPMPDLTPTDDAEKVEQFLNGERGRLGPPGLPPRTDEWPEGVPPSRAYFRTSVWLPAIKAAEVPVRRFHDLRATYISWQLDMNEPLPKVMERVGHTQFQTTRRYTDVLEGAEDSGADAMEAIRRKWRGETA